MFISLQQFIVVCCWYKPVQLYAMPLNRTTHDRKGL